MNKRLVASLLLLPLLTGCCSSVMLRGDPDMLADANSTLAGRDARITKLDGKEFTARDVRITEDAVSWSESGESRRLSLPVESIDSVRVTWRGTGALWGFVIGGGIAGLMAAASYWSDPDEPYADLAFVFFPAVGVLLGTSAGAGAACRDYDLGAVEQVAPAGAGGYGN